MELVLLRIYSSREEHIKDYLDILRREGIYTGAVLQGIAGFGKGREFHAEDIEVLSYELPAVLEAVGEREKLLKILENNSELFKECYITFEKVKIYEDSLLS
ncbi:DUF190 domain-containing protein [Aquifex pyrophilus]